MTYAENTDWPWDADRGDSLTALRIPVTEVHPEWGYTMAFARLSPARPDDSETKILVSYLAYAREHLITAWDRKLYGDRPFDMGNDNSTLVLYKRGPGEWAYRSSNWGATAQWYPPMGQKLSLTEVLDHYWPSEKSKWAEWKAAHPEAFPAPKAAR